MRGKLPGAFLAYGKNAIDDVIHETAFIFNAFCQNQRAKPMTLGKALVLKADTISGS